jgi:hypothetical protein
LRQIGHPEPQSTADRPAAAARQAIRLKKQNDATDRRIKWQPHRLNARSYNAADIIGKAFPE